MENNIVFIGLGTNLGDRTEMLKEAIRQLPPDINPVAFSHIYETPPWGYTDQPAFLNQVIQARTNLSPQSTLKKLKNIEQAIGRKPNFKYGPRLIDLDILFFNDEVIHSEGLSIPHPELSHRGFVLIPLLEIAQDYIHPVLNRSVKEMAQAFMGEDIKPIEETEI